ncbi:hypothetical protein D3C86_997120 [compost metagenome]
MAGQTRARPSSAAGKELGEGIGETPDVQGTGNEQCDARMNEGNTWQFGFLPT